MTPLSALLEELRLVYREKRDQIAAMRANPKSVPEMIGIKEYRLGLLNEIAVEFAKHVVTQEAASK